MSNQPESNKTADLVDVIQTQRTIATTWAKDAKSEFAAGSEQLKTAQKKYEEARSQFNAITETVATAISKGSNVGTLDLQGKIDRAQAANKEFVEYVQKEMNEPGDSGFMDTVRVIIKVAKVIIDIINEASQAKRDQEAAKFRRDTAWPTWGEIS